MFLFIIFGLFCPLCMAQNPIKPLLQEILIPSKNLGENRTVKLNCNLLEGNLADFEWYLNNTKIEPNDRRRIVNHQESSELVIRSLSAEDLGQYSCIARNEQGEDEQRVMLVFNVKPNWVIEPQDLVASIGKEIVLDCLASGYPFPSVRFVKLDDQKQRTVPLQFNSSNKIKFDLNRQTAGSYKCSASNSVGSIEKSVRVSFYGKLIK